MGSFSLSSGMKRDEGRGSRRDEEGESCREKESGKFPVVFAVVWLPRYRWDQLPQLNFLTSSLYYS